MTPEKKMLRKEVDEENSADPAVATVCHIQFVTSGFVVSRDISPGYRTWDVFEGSEFLFLQFGPYYQTVLQRALHGSLELYVLLYPLWYVDIKDQLTEATPADFARIPRQRLIGKIVANIQANVLHKLLDCNELTVIHKLLDCNELIVIHK